MSTSTQDVLVTIIVPVYNAEPYLKDSLSSLTGQTYRNLEIICINDGSTDGSLGILQEFAAADPRIQVISQENKGQAYARNVALSIAKGEWVTGVDSDDTLEPETIRTVVDVISDDVDIICFSLKAVGDVSEERRKLIDDYFSFPWQGKMEVGVEHVKRCNASFATKVYRKSFVDRYGIKFPNGLWYEDSCFHYMAMPLARKVYFLQDRFYGYTQHGDSVMGQTRALSERSIDHVRITVYVHDFYKRHGILDKWKKLYLWFFEVYFMQGVNNSPDYMKDKVYAEAREVVVRKKLMLLDPNNPVFIQLLSRRLPFAKRLFAREYSACTHYRITYFLGMRFRRLVPSRVVSMQNSLLEANARLTERVEQLEKQVAGLRAGANTAPTT